jgi:hypothetical protein
VKTVAKRKKKGKRRPTRGEGRLYKRAGGKDYPADSPVNAPYWLQYTIPNPKGGRGQMVRQALKDADGNPITCHEDAEAARKVVMAPFLAGSRAEAERQLLARVQDAERRQAEAIEAARPVLRITDAWRAYLDSPARPDTGEKTLEQYGIQFRRFAAWMAETHPDFTDLADVTPKVAREYAAHLTATGRSANTFNKYVRLLSLVWRVLGEHTDGNPWNGIARKRQNGHSRRELTVEELRTVCEAATGDLRLLFALGIYTGLRLGDCSTLRWCEVDIERALIRRVPNKARNNKPVIVPIHPTLGTILGEAHADVDKDDVYALQHSRPRFYRIGVELIR